MAEKDGFGEEKNKRIVSKNPFLPYSLILTQQELKKLSEKKVKHIPHFRYLIIEREHLER